MADRVGQQLGNYRLINLLGEGGFAEVYLGEHIYLKSQAALKVLHTRLAKEDLEGFLSEARTLVHLIHPHIVRVLDFGLEGEIPFLVMDYAPNGTLRQRHPKGTILPLPTIVGYVKQVADALQYAHNIKVIHRDIKPENMLLGRDNEILLSDFGMAIIAQSSRYSVVQEIAGTIAYMAPEQIQSHPRPASDQYALGIVVYEWLSGKRPFTGSFTEIAVKHALAPLPSLCEIVPGIPPAVEQVLQMALEKDPAKRFANIRAFATALEQASRDTQFHPFPLASGNSFPTATPGSPSLPAAPPASQDEASLSTALVTPPRQPAELTTPVAPPSSPPIPPITPIPPVQAYTAPAEPLRPTVASSLAQPVSQLPTPKKRRTTGIILVFLLALMIGSFLVTFLALSQRNLSTSGVAGTATSSTSRPATTVATAATTPTPPPTATPSPTPARPAYPNMAGNYKGSIDNTYAGIASSMTLSVNQQQSQGNISGGFTVASPLQGSGPFTGQVNTDKSFHFVVHSNETTAPILFTGTIQSDGSLSGQYCSVNQNTQCDSNAGGHGVWNVTRI